jgi:hypothetical protein
LLWGNVFDADGNYLYSYGGGPFPAPNHGGAISAVVANEGDLPQGDQQLSIFNNYGDGAHGLCTPWDDSSSDTCRFIEINVFQEQVIGAADVGTTWRVEFDAKRGNIEGATTALAFIKTIHPTQFWESSRITIDMTNIPPTWGSYSLSIPINPSLEGHILQFGFLNTATAYEGSGVFYDNVNFGLAPVPVSVDIKPGGCPNPVVLRARGLLPVAILGTDDVDVTTIDPSTIRLEGVAPIRSDLEDVATPFEPFAGGKQDCMYDCWGAGPDGWLDLTAHFKMQDIVAALGDAGDRECRILKITGSLWPEFGGMAFEGEDVGWAVNPGGGGAGGERNDSLSDRPERDDGGRPNISGISQRK